MAATTFFLFWLWPGVSTAIHLKESRFLVTPANRETLSGNGRSDVKATGPGQAAGSPAVAEWAGEALFHLEEWRSDLGERLLRAANVAEAVQSCESFLSFGDYSWCKHAMPKDTGGPEYRKASKGFQEYKTNASVLLLQPPSADSFLALSFGIQAHDAWSEVMSSMYGVKSKLFDCYYAGKEGPAANDLHAGFSKERPCLRRGCYTAEYEMNRVCVDGSRDSDQFTYGNKSYQSLSFALKSRKPLSTFVKMDIEGSEWDVLDRLLDNANDMDKIRHLDMEVHLPKYPIPERTFARLANRTALAHHVEIMERLAQKFVVTGSQIHNLDLEYTKRWLGQPSRWSDPAFKIYNQSRIYTKKGIALDQYYISFMNRKLL